MLDEANRGAAPAWCETKSWARMGMMASVPAAKLMAAASRISSGVVAKPPPGRPALAPARSSQGQPAVATSLLPWHRRPQAHRTPVATHKGLGGAGAALLRCAGFAVGHLLA